MDNRQIRQCFPPPTFCATGYKCTGYNFLIHSFSSIAAAGHFFDNPTSPDARFLILRIEIPYAVAILNTRSPIKLILFMVF